jgi:hypothetical protein
MDAFCRIELARTLQKLSLMEHPYSKFGQINTIQDKFASVIACKSSVTMELLFAIALLIRSTSFESWKKHDLIRLQERKM